MNARAGFAKILEIKKQTQKRILRWASALVILFVLSLSSFGASQARADVGLDPADTATLTGNLETLSKSWDPAAVHSANLIFNTSKYPESNWEVFFNNYFNQTPHPLTDPLRVYLNYPSFLWFSPEIHHRTQNGLTKALWTKVNYLMETNRGRLQSRLSADTDFRQTLFNSHRFFDDLGRNNSQSNLRDLTYTNYKTLVTRYPEFYKAGTIDATTMPYVASLRAQVWMSWKDIKPLTRFSKSEISTALGFQDTTLGLFISYNLILHDNNKASAAQKKIIFDLLSSIPATMIEVSDITIREFLETPTTRVQDYLAKSVINTSGVASGAQSSNPFPSDVAPRPADVFGEALAHELNHVVDSQYVNANQALKSRRDALLARAGLTDLQYLRSMATGKYFQEHPQEFVASIANQWFTDSKHTLDLGVSRFQNGYNEPLNQALFFIDLYSKGSMSTKFYARDADGVLKVTDVAITRDPVSYLVTGLTVGGTKYTFTIDQSGYASSVTSQPTPSQ